jgi:signal transduction histidine kinase
VDPDLLSRWRRPDIQRAGDALLALALAATSIVPVLNGDPSWGRPPMLGLVLAVVSTAPVAWRSRYPLTAAGLVIAANGACIFAAVPYQAAFQPFLALTLVAYTVGSRSEGRRALWVPPVLALAALPLFVAAVNHGQGPGNTYTSYVWLVAAWVVGRSVRSWRHQSEALASANRELAASRHRQEQAAIALERGRIARELHDVIAHNVAIMALQAGAAERVLDGDQPEVRNALHVISATGRETIDDMRSVLGMLRPDDDIPTMRPPPGLSDLAKLTAAMGDTGLQVSVNIKGQPNPLPQVVDLSAYRIIQEALTNTLKHAGPTHADVTLTYDSDGVDIEVRDLGTRVSRGHGTGKGLIGMRERVAMLGGELTAAPTGNGFAVHARLPVTGHR